MTNTTIVDGGILAGGLGTRMGGRDKGLVCYGQRPMVAHIIDVLQPSCRRVWINCNRNDARYAEFSSWRCADEAQTFKGPLSGLAALLHASDADYMLISPCDTPLLDARFPTRMLAALAAYQQVQRQTRKPLVLAARCGERVHPLHLCLARSAVDLIQQQLSENRLRVMDWLTEAQAQFVDFPEKSDCFNNFNQLNNEHVSE